MYCLIGDWKGWRRVSEDVVDKQREDRGIGWREDYEVLRRKFGLNNEVRLVDRLSQEMRRTGKKMYIQKAHRSSIS